MNIKIFLVLLFFHINLFAQQPNKEVAKPVEEKKTYTQDEWNAAVMAEAQKKIEKVHKAENLTRLSMELLNREQKLDDREKELESKYKQIEIYEKEIAQKAKSVNDQINQVLGCVDKNNNDVSKRADHIVTVISNMKPQKAAEILSVQEPALSVDILGKIDPVKASKIFNLMDKEISARLQKQYMNMKR